MEFVQRVFKRDPIPCLCSDTNYASKNLPAECFKATLSKGLGIAIIAGSFLG